ncbi:ANTAR domain-containing protein [Nocardioides sp. Leaf374]|uniref:ANTAR domain-containing protein n=1 Tax=Nocardioides sp. Leaf374 TaxID=2876560 RepID=UPI001E510BC0|nr:ANTAR domain-containing protein [Nocardioides sp. Leaf374]
MQPIPESVAAVDNLDAASVDDDVLRWLCLLGERAREVVPDCVGLTWEHADLDLVLTVEATAAERAATSSAELPVMAATAASDDPCQEQSWSSSGRASAALGVGSTLTLPIMHGQRVVGTVDLYAATPGAFAGRHDELARLFDAWAPGAVTDADLGFARRDDACEAPRRAEDRAAVDTATGVWAALLDVDVVTARERLRETALGLGLTEAELARAVIGRASP